MIDGDAILVGEKSAAEKLHPPHQSDRLRENGAMDELSAQARNFFPAHFGTTLRQIAKTSPGAPAAAAGCE